MNSTMQSKCDRLISNCQIMRAGNRFDYSSIIVAAAAMYLADGREPDPERLKECRKILKRKKGIFSNFRGVAEFIIRCKMSLSDDPESYLADLDGIYKGLKSFFSGEQVVLAAAVIKDMAEPLQYDEVVERTRAIYKEMHAAHPLLTSEEDMPFAALMAVLGSNSDAVCQEAEEIYAMLKGEFSASHQSRQMLSHILSVYDGTPENKCRKVREIATGLRAKRHGLSRDRYIAVLGILADSPIPSDELVDRICEVDEYLKRFRPFKGIFGVGRNVRRMIAVQIVDAAEGASRFASLTGAADVSSVIASSIEVTIITLIMLYTIIAANIAASHNS